MLFSQTGRLREGHPCRIERASGIEGRAFGAVVQSGRRRVLNRLRGIAGPAGRDLLNNRAGRRIELNGDGSGLIGNQEERV